MEQMLFDSLEVVTSRIDDKTMEIINIVNTYGSQIKMKQLLKYLDHFVKLLPRLVI